MQDYGTPNSDSQTTKKVQTTDNRILKFLDLTLRTISIDKNVTNFTGRTNGGHFERQAAIGRRNRPHYSYVAVYTSK